MPLVPPFICSPALAPSSHAHQPWSPILLWQGLDGFLISSHPISSHLTLLWQGLDGFLGPPNPNLDEAMENEHCRESDSQVQPHPALTLAQANPHLTSPSLTQVPFRSFNYGTDTTSEIEFWFVREPTEERKHELRETLKKVPSPERPHPNLAPALTYCLARCQVGAMDGDELVWPLEDPSVTSELAGFMPRKAVHASTTFPGFSEINSQLRDSKMDPLMEQELVAARLYTGPMYLKYNSVLRNLGMLRTRDVLTRSSASFTNDELIDKLRDLEGDTNGATHANLYITTLHVINSAVIKLGKLTSAQKVYRGISSRTLPTELQTPNEYHVRGGIEYGFTSASTQRDEALKYAKPPSPLLVPLMTWQVRQRQACRGALCA
jgi:hypothetical protein